MSALLERRVEGFGQEASSRHQNGNANPKMPSRRKSFAQHHRREIQRATSRFLFCWLSRPDKLRNVSRLCLGQASRPQWIVSDFGRHPARSDGRWWNHRGSGRPEIAAAQDAEAAVQNAAIHNHWPPDCCLGGPQPALPLGDGLANGVSLQFCWCPVAIKRRDEASSLSRARTRMSRGTPCCGRTSTQCAKLCDGFAVPRGRPSR